MRLLEHPPTALPGIEVAQNFRLRRLADGHVVDLPRGKIAIGSSARCNIRLQQPGVQPLHCLIVYEAEGLSIRRWGGDTFLNGEPFDESRLAAGDCLRIATVEFEVVAATAVPPSLTPPNDDNRPTAEFAAAGQEIGESETSVVGHEATGENEGISDEVRDLMHRVEELTRELETATAARQVLVDEAATLAQQHQKLLDESAHFADQEAQRSLQIVTLSSECDQLREQNKQLQAAIAEVREEMTALTTTSSALEEERDRLREEIKRFADVERQMQSAVADRENMSGELYRALLQAAEMQKEVDQFDALAAAHQTLAEQHSELTNRLARLQEQIDARDAESASATDTQHTPSEEDAAASQERQRLSDENAELIASLTEARHQLDEAARQRSEIEGRLQQTDEMLREQREAANRSQAELSERIASLERELVDKQQVEDASIADAERQLRDQAQQLAAAVESRQQLEQQLAAALETRKTLENERDEWQRQYSEARRRQEEQSTRIAELESQLAAMAVAPPREDSTAAQSIGSAEVAESQHLGVPATEDDAEPPAVPGTGETTTGASGAWSQGHETAPAQRPAPAGEADASTQAAVKPEPTSYIERYAHLFADDRPSNEQAAAPAPSPSIASGIEKSRSMNVVSRSPNAAPPASDGDEESIEQYMSKLLQRVRGLSAGSPSAPAQHTEVVSNEPASYRTSLSGSPAAGRTDDSSISGATAFTWANFDATRKKNPTPEPKTDLEALRALANESARRAISRHALRKHRRNALTKVIVATLAGATSLLLILESPDWRSLQFITACVLLPIAAYWAAQTFRALLKALSERADDELDEGVAEAAAGLQSPLPIDIDSRGSLRND